MSRTPSFLPIAALPASILVFAWPELSVAARSGPVSYPLVTVAFTLVIVAIVWAWPAGIEPAPSGPRSSRRAVLLAVLVVAAAMGIAAYRWTELMAWLPYHADMLIVIREATRRFLSGHNPYTTYRSYDTSWEMAMPYGPALWGPFVLAQLLRLDLRIVTIVGELFAPAWCGAAAVVAASRGRPGAAALWLSVMAALVVALDVQRFTLIGHTPVYWPWLLLFAVMVATDRWTGAACLLGILVAARTTMIAIVPVFLMAAWRAQRRPLPVVVTALSVTSGVALVPFLVWDYRAVWDSMILSYPRVMKAAVWPVLARPGMETIGVTEWLLEHHRESLVVPVQIVAMIAVYAAAWVATRGRPALPWMALALFAFSMTTLYPVHYLYYDVLLLLVFAALIETLGSPSAGRAVTAWIGSLAALAVLVLVVVRFIASPFPQVAVGDPSSNRLLRAGFSGVEHDRLGGFAWIVGNEARIALPRGSTAAADIVLTVESPFDVDGNRSPQRMTAILNGQLLSDTVFPAGRRQIRIAAPRSAWWIGFNDLRLTFSSTVSPRDIGAGEDSRPLALALVRVDVLRQP